MRWGKGLKPLGVIPKNANSSSRQSRQATHANHAPTANTLAELEDELELMLEALRRPVLEDARDLGEADAHAWLLQRAGVTEEIANQSTGEKLGW